MPAGVIERIEICSKPVRWIHEVAVTLAGFEHWESIKAQELFRTARRRRSLIAFTGREARPDE
jgi:hypothetical protein